MHVVIPANDYSLRVNNMLRDLTTPSESDTEIRLTAVGGKNYWSQSNIKKRQRKVTIFGMAGSRLTKLPADNLLFEVVFHTPQSMQIEREYRILLQMLDLTGINVFAIQLFDFMVV